jgi:hypothetical protein
MNGTGCIGTVMDGDYGSDQAYEDCYAELPPIDLASAVDPVLVFYQYVDSSSSDGGNVQISTDSGGTFEVAVPNPAYHGSAGGLDAFTGDHSADGWQRVLVSLSSFVGQSVVVRFSFHSNSYTSAPGWYVDQVGIYESANVPVVIETTADLGLAFVGDPFQASLAASGGGGTYDWTIEGGTSHSWLSIDPATGELTGTADSSHLGLTTVVVRAADVSNTTNYDEKSFEIQVVDALLYESFAAWPPAGWTIVDGGSTTDTWMHCDGCGVGLTGADGAYAMVNSDAAGSGSISLVEELITPSIDCSAKTTVLLEFYHYYNHIGSGEGRVEVSVDGGASWTQIVSYTSDTVNGALESFDISAHAAGQADVKIRFLYDDGSDWAWYWLVDDVTVLGM